MRTFGSTQTAWDLDVLVWMGGDPKRVGEALETTLRSVSEKMPDAFVTLLVDGPGWERALRSSARRIPNRREIHLSRATDLPQVLYGLGLDGSSHSWLSFLWPGCGIAGEGLASLIRAAPGAGRADLIYGDSAAPAAAELFHPIQPGWLQMADLIPMHNCVVRREAAARIDFDPSPLVRRSFWWDFTLRLSRGSELAHVPAVAAPPAWYWNTFPFRAAEPGDADLAARYMARGGRDTAADFGRDLPPADLSPPAAARPEGRWPLKITLLSGLLDAHQNQLFFYNFFDKVKGRGLLTWRTILYERCTAEDLAGCDLAIFSRPRFPEAPGLLDHCRAAGVPVLAMIDDNWIAAGREFPRFERLFTPGKPPFEVFLDCLRRADATLVFNPTLEEDVKPLARRVLRLPANVELSLFEAPQRPQEREFLAGFAGSPRWQPSGFRGLARFLQRRTDARLLIMAHELPEELREISPERLTFVRWRHDYAAYARKLAELRPDVLIAPLDASRFSASKIPIKLLESAAVGAAGIYSRVLPYTDHVRDGETGLLVENDEEAWEDALERLYAKPELRERLAGQAALEVRERFATERVLPAFLDVLQKVVWEPVG